MNLGVLVHFHESMRPTEFTSIDRGKVLTWLW